MLEIKKAFLKRGYDLVVIGGRMTGDIQVNDTNIHFSFKAKNRQLKQDLMISRIITSSSNLHQIRHIEWHETCKCKCRLHATVCNKKELWINTNLNVKN